MARALAQPEHRRRQTSCKAASWRPDLHRLHFFGRWWFSTAVSHAPPWRALAQPEHRRRQTSCKAAFWRTDLRSAARTDLRSAAAGGAGSAGWLPDVAARSRSFRGLPARPPAVPPASSAGGGAPRPPLIPRHSGRSLSRSTAAYRCRGGRASPVCRPDLQSSAADEAGSAGSRAGRADLCTRSARWLRLVAGLWGRRNNRFRATSNCRLPPAPGPRGVSHCLLFKESTMVKRVFDFATRIGTLAWNRALPVPGRDPSRWRLTADGWPVFYRFRSKQNGLFSYQLDHKKAPPKGEEQKKEFYKSEENCQLLGVRVNHAKGSHNDKGIEEFEKYQHHIKPCSYWMDLLEIFACGDVTDENGRILWASYSKEEMRKMTKASRMKASVPQYPTPGCIGDLCTLQCQMAGASSFALRYLESVKDGQHVNEAMLEDERERLTRLTREMSHKLLCIEYQLKWVEMKLLKDKEHKNHIVEDTLFKAAFDGDLARVKDIMKSLGIGIDNRAAVFSLTNKNGFGVLHCAACQGHLEVCKYLVEELGGDPNVTAAASEGLTPFMASAKSGDVSTVKYLLDHGGELMKSDEKGFTVLHHAAFTELDGSLLYDAHVVLQFGYYWLFIVIYSVYSVHVIYGIILRTAGSCNVTEFLLSKGIPVDIDFGHGTPLLHAAMVGQDKTLKILLHHHANPNIIFSGVGTPLMAALVNRSLKCMKLLIKAGADVNGKGTITSPLLFAAEQGGYTNFIQLLLKAGADPNIPDDLGRLPVDLAALNDCRDEVEMLFPLTLPIPGVPNWSVDGVISHAKLKNAGPLDEQCIKRRKDILKSQADMAFKRKEYDVALKTYDMLLDHAPDATRDSNRSLCKLLMGDGKGALSDAYRCKMMRPDWAKACYRQAAAHMLLKEYKQAHDALLDAQNLDPGNDEIKRELRKATELMKTSSEP